MEFATRLAGPGAAAVLLCFALLKLYSLRFVMGDEHMYFYMSLLVSRGAWPYRDFFFSHPPLQLYLMGGLYTIAGYSLVLSKAVPSVAAMVSGAHVYLIGRRLMGRLEALLAVALFLFSFDVLRGSSHFTAANCALALGLAGAYQAVVRRPVLAGGLFAVGTFTGVYMAPLALMLIVLVAFRSGRESVRLLLSYGAVCALVCAVFAGVAGHAFWYQVFTYNLHKAAMPYSWFAKFRNVFYLNTPNMIGFLPAVFWAAAMWAVRGRGRRETPAGAGSLRRAIDWLDLWAGDRVAAQMVFGTLILGYFYFYSTRVDYYSYYFMLIMPWMALMTAYVAVDVVRFARERWRPRPAPVPAPTTRQARRKPPSPGPPPGMRRPVWPLAGCAVVLAGVVAFRQSIGVDRSEEMGAGAMRFTWLDAPYLGTALNGVVRALFWSPTYDPVHLPGVLTRYLQHETMSATTIDQFVHAVRRECRPGERIFGEYSLGPFAAAVGSCVLGANLADTNPHRWTVGESTAEDWIRALEADHLDIAIVAPGSSMMRSPAMRAYLTETFPRVVYTWNDPYMGHVELRRRGRT